MTLAGILCVRNGTDLDYCWRESGQSLLSVCDELVLSDCDSTDNTRYVMNEWAGREPRITLCNYPWTDPTMSNTWYPEWINYARQHAKSRHIIHLDADELIHEEDYGLIRRAAEAQSVLFCHRLNFWRDPQHLIPDGVCCGTKVLRVAPANMPIPSDYPWEPAADTMKAAQESAIRVYHYGFLRKREAFFRKARVVQHIWTGGYDPRLEAAEKAPGNWMEHENVTGWEKDLNEFTGTHPEIAKPWLRERGYEI